MMTSGELDSEQAFRSSNSMNSVKKELMSSVKFHHGKTLQNIPLEVALEAMKEAWLSVNRK
jgi:hypothetical protein